MTTLHSHIPPRVSPPSPSPSPSPQHVIFRPSPQTASDIIQALTDPERSLAEIAQEHATTVDALAVWLCTPAAAERLTALLHAQFMRVNILVGARLPAAVTTIAEAIDSIRSEAAVATKAEAHATPLVATGCPSEFREREKIHYIAQRRRDTIRSLGELLVQMAVLRMGLIPSRYTRPTQPTETPNDPLPPPRAA